MFFLETLLTRAKCSTLFYSSEPITLRVICIFSCSLSNIFFMFKRMDNKQSTEWVRWEKWGNVEIQFADCVRIWKQKKILLKVKFSLFFRRKAESEVIKKVWERERAYKIFCDTWKNNDKGFSYFPLAAWNL